MTNVELAALPVADLAAPVACLYLWVTNPVLVHPRNAQDGTTVLDIVRAWGFEPVTMLTWCKTLTDLSAPRLGMGWHFRGATEHVIYATRGGLGIPTEKREANVIHAAPGAHSAKPAAFYDLVERVSPPEYLELFARQPRLGWPSWGYGYEGAPTMTTNRQEQP